MQGKNKSFYLLMLVGVVLMWGVMPIITKELFAYFSPAIKTAFSAFIAFSVLLIINIKRLKQLNAKYFLIALPTGVFYGLACVLQQVGLMYTTPTMYAFLENLSCLVVPVLVWIMTKKSPSVFKFIGAGLCLISVFILSGGLKGFSNGFGIGEIFCALAGIFYGVNIAVTGVKAKEFNAGLYLMIQFFVSGVISLTYALCFEEIRFTSQPLMILALVAVVLCSSVLGWMIRTICVVNLDPSLVAVIMPFSAVITAIVSVIFGKDVLSWSLAVGAVVGLISCLVSDLTIKKLKRIFSRNKN